MAQLRNDKSSKAAAQAERHQGWETAKQGQQRGTVGLALGDGFNPFA
jgi:hypothetical protein